ncbi:hypothetical protein NDU88_000778 [Pleurodeles waltl]|uniref:Secreted protein n=1 Tax=Pleurodeles waltl TaxID=8319 RepID=A0AAV7UV16_PLEWA|nr:hypothetical protein NDU88_000778 [Pleurodeles waltl]
MCPNEARLCCLMSLFPGLSPLRVAGRGAEMNCCSETPRLSVLSIKPWTEAYRVLYRRDAASPSAAFGGHAPQLFFVSLGRRWGRKPRPTSVLARWVTEMNVGLSRKIFSNILGTESNDY